MGANGGIKATAFFAVFVVLVGTVHSLRCYQCSGTNNTHPFQCNEFLSSDVDIEPQSCDAVFGAQYCVKHTGRFEGGIGTKRFCSAVHMGNYCNYEKQPGDKLTYRTCVFTCTGDGCNPATNAMPTAATWIVPIVLLASYRLLCQR